MSLSSHCGWRRPSLAALVALFSLTLLVRSEPTGCLTLDQLQQMSPCQLEALFTQADLGQPLVGCAHGRLVYMADRRLHRVRTRLANTFWKGKAADSDGHFTNRWLGGFQAIRSQYVIGPSWVDGRPALIMEYAPGTPLFANTHDEFREIAPGLYLGPLYDRFPCPKFRGWLALQLEPCKGCRR